MSFVDYFIVIVGLLISCAGAYFAWNNKGAGTWATFGFGFLLVLVGGPASSRLGTLSLTGTGVEVEFNAKAVSKAEQTELAEKASSAFSSLSPTPGTAEKVLLGSASQRFQKDLISYILSIGFVPIEPTGAEIVEPGALVRFEEGRLILWATSAEAFPDLVKTESSIAIPSYDQATKVNDSETMVSFNCTNGSLVSEASLLAFSTSVSDRVRPVLAGDPRLRVVKATIVCAGFRIAAKTRRAGKEDQDSLAYPDKSRLVLGVKMATFQAQK